MRIQILSAALATAAALTLTACGTSSGGNDKGSAVSDVSVPPKTSAAITVDKPMAKPDLILTDTSGKTYDLAKETQGRPVLLYFGYTHCPDVCPLIMSNLAIAEKKLTKAEQAELRVVFVTTDPQDDNPKRIRTWLDMQGGQDFVGLTGDFNTIQAAARPLGVLVDKPKREKDGSVTVDHGAEVIAFSPKDDKAHWIYTTDTRADQYAKELPKITEGENP
jgi:protein SCO1